MSTRRQVSELLKAHELRLKRSFGQSFLVEDRVLEGIARAACSGDEPAVVEIGTGLGTLTRALAAQGRPVVTIEYDRSLIPVLQDLFPPEGNVRVVEGDALEVDLATLAGPGVRPAVAGNLPYSITSPLILALIAQRDRIGLTTIMIQREVADRLAAHPGTKAYGSLSVMLQLHADVEHVFDVPPGCFLPPPKVHSSVLRIRFFDTPRVPVEDLQHFERVVRAAFSKRRKTLRNALRSSFSLEAVERAESCGIELTRRGETLSIAEFAQLARSLFERDNTHPSNG